MQVSSGQCCPCSKPFMTMSLSWWNLSYRAVSHWAPTSFFIICMLRFTCITECATPAWSCFCIPLPKPLVRSLADLFVFTSSGCEWSVVPGGIKTITIYSSSTFSKLQLWFYPWNCPWAPRPSAMGHLCLSCLPDVLMFSKANVFISPIMWDMGDVKSLRNSLLWM